VIEPSKVNQAGVLPSHGVMCFFREVIAKVAEEHGAEVIHSFRCEAGDHPIYRMQYQGKPVVFVQPGVGSAHAGACFEEFIAHGVSKCTACGGAGVLDKAIAVGHVLVPESAVRDEGTSYHYMPPSREVAADPESVAAIERVLVRHKVAYLRAKTWTTDAPYRETTAKVKRRREEGCLTVEMEAAAFFAVARFRGVRFGQLLYGGDDVSSETWDDRKWDTRTTIREKLFWLAVESVLEIP